MIHMEEEIKVNSVEEQYKCWNKNKGGKHGKEQDRIVASCQINIRNQVPEALPPSVCL